MPFGIGNVATPDALIISAAAQRLAYWDLKPTETGSAVWALLNRDLADLGRPDLTWRSLTPTALSIDPIWYVLSGAQDEDSGAPDDDGVFENENAAVFAVRNDDTLLICFRGSNGKLWNGITADYVDAATNIDAYLEKLSIFLEALKSYLGGAEGSDIGKIIVTGHSLGAAAATAFANGIDSDTVRLSDLIAATNSNPDRTIAQIGMSDVDIILHASPGVSSSGSYGAVSARIIEVQLTDDPVPGVVPTHVHPQAAYLGVTALNHFATGELTIVPIFDLPGDALAGGAEHNQDLYFTIMADLNTAAFADVLNPTVSVFALSAIGAPLNAAGFDDTRDISDWALTLGAERVILGLSGDDRIFGNAGVNYLHGGTGRDELTGNASGDFLDGGGGDDFLRGLAGNDRLWGGFGNDTYSVGISEGADIISDQGSSGPDTIAFYSGSAFDHIDFGWFSIDPNNSADLLVRAYDGAVLVLDLRIQNMGSSAGAIELFDLYASAAMSFSPGRPASTPSQARPAMMSSMAGPAATRSMAVMAMTR